MRKKEIVRVKLVFVLEIQIKKENKMKYIDGDAKRNTAATKTPLRFMHYACIL